VTLVCLSCDWSSPEAKKAKHRERAISYFEKSQYQEARFEYQNVVQIDPNDADAHYRLARLSETWWPPIFTSLSALSKP
jgi:Tfp pilus assembly protein PilF